MGLATEDARSKRCTARRVFPYNSGLGCESDTVIVHTRLQQSLDDLESEELKSS